MHAGTIALTHPQNQNSKETPQRIDVKDFAASLNIALEGFVQTHSIVIGEPHSHHIEEEPDTRSSWMLVRLLGRVLEFSLINPSHRARTDARLLNGLTRSRAKLVKEIVQFGASDGDPTALKALQEKLTKYNRRFELYKARGHEIDYNQFLLSGANKLLRGNLSVFAKFNEALLKEHTPEKLGEKLFAFIKEGKSLPDDFFASLSTTIKSKRMQAFISRIVEMRTKSLEVNGKIELDPTVWAEKQLHESVQKELNELAIHNAIKQFIDEQHIAFDVIGTLQKAGRVQQLRSIKRPDDLQLAHEVKLLEIVHRLRDPEIAKFIQELEKSSLAEDKELAEESANLLKECELELRARGSIKSATAMIEPLMALAQKVDSTVEWTQENRVSGECEEIVNRAVGNIPFLHDARYWLFKLALAGLDDKVPVDDKNSAKILERLSIQTLTALSSADRSSGIAGYYEEFVQIDAIALNKKIDEIRMERLRSQVNGFYKYIEILDDIGMRSDKNLLTSGTITLYKKFKDLQKNMPERAEKHQLEEAFYRYVRTLGITDLYLRNRSEKELKTLRKIIEMTPVDEDKRWNKAGLLLVFENPSTDTAKGFIPAAQDVWTNLASAGPIDKSGHSAGLSVQQREKTQQNQKVPLPQVRKSKLW